MAGKTASGIDGCECFAKTDDRLAVTHMGQVAGARLGIGARRADLKYDVSRREDLFARGRLDGRGAKLAAQGAGGICERRHAEGSSIVMLSTTRLAAYWRSDMVLSLSAVRMESLACRHLVPPPPPRCIRVGVGMNNLSYRFPAPDNGRLVSDGRPPSESPSIGSRPIMRRNSLGSLETLRHSSTDTSRLRYRA